MNVSSDLMPLAFRGRSQQCWRWDADFSSSQSAEIFFGYEATLVGATGIGGAGWSDNNLPGYDARRVCAKGETARNRFS